LTEGSQSTSWLMIMKQVTYR